MFPCKNFTHIMQQLLESHGGLETLDKTFPNVIKCRAFFLCAKSLRICIISTKVSNWPLFNTVLCKNWWVLKIKARGPLFCTKFHNVQHTNFITLNFSYVRTGMPVKKWILMANLKSGALWHNVEIFQEVGEITRGLF